ncbi:MAG: hypothetical protein WCV83_00505 [Candidatus Magasanikbacteria bacterium]|jgi:hypothetical protein
MEPITFSSTFGFSINWEFWSWMFSQPPADLIAYLFAIIGWVILVLICVSLGSQLLALYRAKKADGQWEWVLLAVDVPPLFIQSPKAVEQIFAHLSGAKVSIRLSEKYWIGKRQKNFSFEIISIEGYIQFLIRTEIAYRDLVEAAVYAQYPEAEITEVEDYVDMIPGSYPSATHHMFGVEFQLADVDAYPIRTYPNFEYKISKDEVFSDPMAAILENFSRIGHGEHFWLQIIIEPVGNDWKTKGIQLVKDIIAGHIGHHGNFWGDVVAMIGNIPLAIMKEFFKYLNASEHEEEEVHKEMPGKLTDVSPGGKSTIEAIEDKIAKLGFKTKIRALYVARNEVFNPTRCVDGFIGSLNQFHIQSRNAIIPRFITHTHFLFYNHMREIWVQNKFFKAFAKRKIKVGGTPYILNIEELATLWHFPLPFVKTPLVQKAGAKRGEPPMNLPIEVESGPLRPKVRPTGQVGETVEVPEQEPEELLYG